MNSLPTEISELLSDSDNLLNVVFSIDDDGDAIFILANQNFIDFHENLGVTLRQEDIIGMKAQDYFRLYLGFTDDQIDSRMECFNTSIESEEPYHFKEVSEHPNIPVLILSSVWKPVNSEAGRFMIWESSVYIRTELN